MMLDKIKAWCRHSWTVAWAYLKGLAGMVLLMGPELNDKVTGDPNISSILQQYSWAGYVLMGLAVVTFMARVMPHMHDAEKDDEEDVAKDDEKTVDKSAPAEPAAPEAPKAQ